ncbi:hypothetical protein GCM10011335_28600 [Aureimonas glaciei]|uniref:IclR family transcriptional regulator n=1 Tax=Aureimonas glaciei TaxID=1776957 RepID=A0A917DBX6_9HYPH|nr:hypothetical protein GCM10011335_28600 [Aureimonas glaciei]
MLGGKRVSGRGSERVLDMLEWFAAQAGAVSLAAVVQALDLPKSSTLLLLRLLAERGYLERLGDGTYVLIRLPGEREPGREAWGTLLRLSEAPLREAVAASNETGFIAILEKREVRYLTKVLPAREIRYDRDITKLRMAHQVASGVVMLAGLAASDFEDYLGQLAPELRSEVSAAVASARSDGFCVNLKGVVEGAAGIAAPIRDGDGMTVAAINISGPRERIVANVPRLTDIAVHTARLVSEELTRRSRTQSRNPGRN